MKRLKELALEAGVEFIRVRGNRALIRERWNGQPRTRLVTRQWLQELIDENQTLEMRYDIKHERGLLPLL